LKDALAVLRTATLLARDFRAPLNLDLPGSTGVPVTFDGASFAESRQTFLDSTKRRLQELVANGGAALMLEVNIIAATFISAGSISVRIRNVDATVEPREAVRRRNRA